MDHETHDYRRQPRAWLTMLLTFFFAAGAVADDTGMCALGKPGNEPWPSANKLGNGPFTVNGYTSVQVNVDASGGNIPLDAANEPTLAIDPTDPQRIVIGWRQFDDVNSSFRESGYAYSHDGGATWTFAGSLEDDGVNEQFGSDPVIDVDSSGRFYYLRIRSAQNFRHAVSYSDDGGVTWTAPVETGFAGDKDWLAVDRSGGPGDGNLYVTSFWTTDSCRPCVGAECGTSAAPNYLGNGEACNATTCCEFGTFVRSTDGGASFENRVAFDPFDLQDSTLMPVNVTVGPDGEVYIAGVSFDDVSAQHRNLVYRSDDAEEPNLTPTFTQTVVDLGGVAVQAGTPNPDGQLGQPEIRVDWTTGPTRGHVYLISSVEPDTGSDPYEVHFTRSTDGGATWSPPVRISDDPAGNGAFQWFATMAVAPDGRIDAVWNDTRNDPSGTVSELFYSYSYDGGITWSANVAVSPAWNSLLGHPSQPRIGDYIGIVPDATSSAVAYAATMNGEQDIYFMRVFPDCNGNGISDVTDIASGASLDGNGDHIPDECQVDTTPPTGSISADPCTVTLDLSVTDSSPIEMLLGADPAFTGSTWQPFAPQPVYTVAGCSGGGTVFVKYRDAAGNESPTYSAPFTAVQ